MLTQKSQAFVAETLKSYSHLHSHQLVPQSTVHWWSYGAAEQEREGERKISRMKESDRVMGGMDGGGGGSPDGTVKRIHNGNTTLVPFRVHM